MFDKPYKEALDEWIAGYFEWKENPKDKCEFWEWDGGPPDPDYYRGEWTEEPIYYQIYEDVSEGTPVSPIFTTLDEMKEWLLQEGFSEQAISRFIEHGWAPSFVMTPKGMSGIGIHSLDFN
jgi:hypothetical protein